MNKQDITKSFKNFCPVCVHLQTETNVCKKIQRNVLLYPKAFVKKCNSESYEYDPHKTEAHKQLNESIKNMTHEELIEMLENQSNVYPKEVLSIATSIADKRGGLRLLKEHVKRRQEERVSKRQEEGKKQSSAVIEIIGSKEEVASSGYEFKTLLGYGKFISGVGWIVIILGVIGILAGISIGDDEGWLIAGGALFTALAGLGLVVSGQLVSCFVSIEKNTRVTNEILQQKH
jgi:hypothetical protein